MNILQSTELSDILEAVLSHAPSKANAAHLLALSETEKSIQEVVYTSIVDQAQQMDLNEDGFLDDQNVLIAAVKTNLKTRVQTLVA